MNKGNMMVEVNKSVTDISAPVDSRDGFRIAEEKRRWKADPNAWVGKLRPEFMERIKYYENYLAKWGITAQTGIEQEFWVVTKVDERGIAEQPKIAHKPNYFKHSPFIQEIYPDHSDCNGYELVIGTGNGANEKIYPQPSLEPSVMVRATESANKLISYEAGKPENPYNSVGIDFDPTNHGSRLYAQQVNISLWDRDNKPLFNNEGISRLGKNCVRDMLEAQNALVTLYTVNPHAFKRFASEDRVYTKGKDISLHFEKIANPSVLWRDANRPYSMSNSNYAYIENRLGSSDMPPYVNMLITIAGIANGVREYAALHNIVKPDPDKLMRELRKDSKLVQVLSEGYINSQFKRYQLPKTQEQALKITEGNGLAREILGDDLYNKFISGYKTHCLNTGVTSHRG